MERLHRSKRNKVILGVCGGLAEYFRIDPTLIRIIWILITFAGVGIVGYVIAALVMPEDRGFSTGSDQWKSSTGTNSTGTNSGKYAETGASPDTGASYESEFESDTGDWDRPAKYNSGNTRLVLGAILVGLGALFLGRQLMPGLFEIKYILPLLLIGVGGIIVFKGRH